VQELRRASSLFQLGVGELGVGVGVSGVRVVGSLRCWLRSVVGSGWLLAVVVELSVVVVVRRRRGSRTLPLLIISSIEQSYKLTNQVYR
jgi:hypothetical protein